MSATILTLGLAFQIFWFVFVNLALMPLLAGIIARILSASLFIAGPLAIVLALGIARIKIQLMGIEFKSSVASLLNEFAFPIVFIASFALIGVRSASGFYSGLGEVTKSGHN